jgi:WD40 repeat protein
MLFTARTLLLCLFSLLLLQFWALLNLPLVRGGDDVPAVTERSDPLGDALPKRSIGRLGTTRLRQDNSFTRATFFDEGRSVALISSDHTLRIWDAATGKLQTTRFQGENVEPHVFSAGGKLVSYSDRNGVRVLALDRRDEVYRLWRDWDTVGEVFASRRAHTFMQAFSPDQSLLAAGGGDVLQMWNIRAGTLRWEGKWKGLLRPALPR